MCPTNAHVRTEHHIQVCQDILKQNKAKGDSILDPIITGDKEWCHTMSWSLNGSDDSMIIPPLPTLLPLKKFKVQPSVGNDVYCLWDKKGQSF